MLDQLKIGSKYSLDDFGASLAERTIKAPSKKEIKETVPFSNLTHDFSKINGELYWEERELEYVFEIIADTPEELESKKISFSNWVMNVMNENIYDPYLPDFHFVGTYSDMEYADDDCVEKTTATVIFKAYPYKIADEETAYSYTITRDHPVQLYSDSAHRISPTVQCDYDFTITENGKEYAFPAGTSKNNEFFLEPGVQTSVILNFTSTKVGTFVRDAVMNEKREQDFSSIDVYETCTANADGSYTLSGKTTAGYRRWFEYAGTLFRMDMVYYDSEDNLCYRSYGYKVEVVDSVNHVKISFRREVF